MAITENIIINQDADFSKQLIAKTDAGVVIDLTGSTLTAQVRKSFASSTKTDFTTTIVTATDGTYTIALTDAQSAVLERGRHVYDVIVTDSGSLKTRVNQGVATVSPSVTRPA